MQLRERKLAGAFDNQGSPHHLKPPVTPGSSCSSVNECSRRASHDSNAASVYREHAAHYAQKFRAAIDYTTREEPRQILWGFILVLSLLLLGFRDQLLPSSSQVNLVHRGAGEAVQPTVSPSETAVAPGAKLPGNDATVKCTAGSRKKNDNEDVGADGGDDPNESCQRATPEAPRVSEQQSSTSGRTQVAPSVFSSIFGGSSSASVSSPLSTNVRRVVTGLLVLVCLYCFLQAKDGLLVRPHPGFWRLVHGVCLVHLIVMVVLLVLDVETGLLVLELLFPEIAGKRKEIFAGTLVLDCRINGDTIKRQLTSVWFISHVVGWLGKMVILRNWGLCLLYSIFFELGELSFHWLVPELCECWWDSIFIDALLSNVSGMLLGAVFMKFINMHQYDWLGRHPLYQKVFMSLTPFSSEGYDWSFYKTPRHLFLSIALLTFCVFLELNVFFLMAALDIPATHYINPLRTLYLTLLGAAAAPEHYEYTMFSRERVGHNEWLLVVILSVELLVCVKYGAGRYNAETPPLDLVIPWVAALSLFAAWCYCYFSTADLRGNNGEEGIKAPVSHARRGGEEMENLAEEPKKTKRSEKHRVHSWQDQAKLLVITVPPQACFIPLLYLMKFYFYDYVKIERNQ
ncbi:putative phosphatidylserine synthase [Neospora caninum Liverpool]|uniref:Phosphatidylserine synthase, putative n=2 Tax=Neospora caninum TaxID=29176 RepID=F0VIR3_NEOCL|nr:putative phosphatidylserine synthase [Neospora caninum Liverpool]AIB09106.1 putative phosphatidylthreonine synthase [Neospora caninum]CBZ53624.1 putative phosphatidylserine synthase [Neospora caninum Liverpool]CEL67615.1 TPA: phosphatidylserine synthase, putative [Neospora caninum Liverpool]|eukprot:XP_003883656.1 putative phosphatidylserine synthase [Neospora caninum Liverpool]